MAGRVTPLWTVESGPSAEERALVEAPTERAAQLRVNAQLVLTPILALGALGLVIGVAPDTAGQGSNLIFRNPTLEVFACVAQTLFFIWIYAFAAHIWHLCPKVDPDTLVPGSSTHRLPLLKLSFWGSVLFFVLTAIFMG